MQNNITEWVVWGRQLIFFSFTKVYSQIICITTYNSTLIQNALSKKFQRSTPYPQLLYYTSLFTSQNNVRRRARALPVRRRARAPWCILLLALKGGAVKVWPNPLGPFFLKSGNLKKKSILDNFHLMENPKIL